jgi:hypothetical protein
MRSGILLIICLVPACNSGPSKSSTARVTETSAGDIVVSDAASTNHEAAPQSSSSLPSLGYVLPASEDVGAVFSRKPRSVMLFNIGVGPPWVAPDSYTASVLRAAKQTELPIEDFWRFVGTAKELDHNIGWKGGRIAEFIYDDQVRLFVAISDYGGYLKVIGPKLPCYQIDPNTIKEWNVFLNTARDVLLSDGALFSPSPKPKAVTLYEIEVNKPWVARSVYADADLTTAKQIALPAATFHAFVSTATRVDQSQHIHWKGGWLVELVYEDGSHLFVALSRYGGYLRGIGVAPFYEVDPQLKEKWHLFVSKAVEVMHASGVDPERHAISR